MPYSHVLNAVLARGLPMPPDVFRDLLKAMSQTQGPQNGQLNQLSRILHKHWPTDVKKILVTLFMDTDPTIKHLAFSLLGRESEEATRRVAITPVLPSRACDSTLVPRPGTPLAI